MVREGYKQTEVGVIPEDWEVVDLGSLFQFKNGINATKEQYGTGYKFINVLDIIENEFITHDKIIGRVNVDASSYAKNEVSYGDIVFQRSSETAEEVGQAAVYLDEANSATFGGFVILGKKNGDFDSRYLNYQLQSPACRREIVNQSGGSTRYNISQVALRRAKTILPPTQAEQRAIATALSDTDALLSSLDALIGKKEAFKRGMMEGLLSHTGSWQKMILGDILAPTSTLGGNYSNSTKEEGIPLIKMGNLGRGEMDLERVMYTTDKNVDPNHFLKENDVLFNTRNTPELVGKIALWRGELDSALFNSNLYRLDFVKEYVASNVFMNSLFNMPQYIHQMSQIAIGTTSVAAIYGRDLMKFELSLPPLPEQRAIATVLSDLDAELMGLRARRAKLGLVKGGMMEVLLGGEVRLV